MKKTYQILGMTCENCRLGVEEKLYSIEGIKKVEVSLENAQASILMSHEISLSQLSQTLGTKYTLNELGEVGDANSKLKQLRPLFLIFLYLIAASVFLSKGESLRFFMTNFMGLFYVVFSFFKFLDYQRFPSSFQQYDFFSKQLPIYAWIYPFLETLLGVAFLMQWKMHSALWISVLVLLSTSVGVIKQLQQKSTIQCACLGTSLNLPMTEATLIENLIMLSMSVGMLLDIYIQ